MSQHDPQFYDKALAALEAGNFAEATQLCLDAIKHFSTIGSANGASVAYHLFGGVSYQAGDLEAARSYYLKSLEYIDPPSADQELDFARTCNNLAAVFNQMGDSASAKNWMLRSIQIKERVGDPADLASGYHQLGVVAQTVGEFDEAADWYSKSLAVEENSGNIPGTVATLRCLANVAAFRELVETEREWYQRLHDFVCKNCDSPTVEAFGDQALQDQDFYGAAILFKSACELVRAQKNH